MSQQADQNNLYRLRNCIISLRSTISNQQGALRGEQNAKAALIEPILDALGWNTRNPTEVCREFRAHKSDNPVDYALRLPDSSIPWLVVEAKGLGGDLDERRWLGQVLSYAVMASPKWCVLTNGDEWRVYNPRATADSPDQRLLLRFCLSKDDPDASAQWLALLTRDSAAGDQLERLWQTETVRKTLLRLVANKDKGLCSLISKQTEVLKAKAVAELLDSLLVRADLQSSLRSPDLPSKGMSGLEAAEVVLSETGRAMTIKDLLMEIRNRNLWSTTGRTPEATIYAAIIREIRTKGSASRFAKAGRGLFSLSKPQ